MLPDAMTAFIRKHHVLTLSAGDEQGVWSAHCFYAWDQERGCFVFTSDAETRHIQMIEGGAKVAAAIALETKVIGKIQGLQITGRVEKPLGEEYAAARHVYLKRFPYAVIVKTSFWVLYPDYAKMTDNRLGFGKKIIWP